MNGWIGVNGWVDGGMDGWINRVIVRLTDGWIKGWMVQWVSILFDG